VTLYSYISTGPLPGYWLPVPYFHDPFLSKP